MMISYTYLISWTKLQIGHPTSWLGVLVWSLLLICWGGWMACEGVRDIGVPYTDGMRVVGWAD